MNYDNLFVNQMKNIGIAYLLEQKHFKKNNTTETYYELIDYAYGFIYNFGDVGMQFTPLSRNVNYNFPLKYKPSEKIIARNFKSFDELSVENGNSLNIEKFTNQYKKRIGQLFFYNAANDCFDLITDKNIINQIENDNKEFNENILNKVSDISQMYSEIKKTIISQDEQIMKILTTLFKNQKVVNENFNIDMIGKLKENLIIYGSTGTGKTEILKRIAKIYKVPIVIEDATSLSETGFVGRDITNMLEDLYLAANKDIDKAQKGILVIDEFDKLAEKPGAAHDHISRIGVQRSLLKLLDGTEYYFNGLTFNTSKLSVVALGAFTDMVKDDDYSNITTKNFVEYGIM